MSVWVILKSLRKKYRPSKEKFYSSLTGKKISGSNKKYDHVLNVWNKLEMKTRKYYDDSYLKCNVMLLADVLEKFWNNSLKNDVLCPIHYLSAPDLSWDALLNIKKSETRNYLRSWHVHIPWKRCERWTFLYF